MTAAILLILAQLLSGFTAQIPIFRTSVDTRAVAGADALPNDNRTAAGLLVNGVLTLQLEAREALWYPENKPGVAIPIFAFAEVGQPTRIPGPLIRIPAGTDVRATVHNTLTKPIRFRGLQDYGTGALDTLIIAPGASQEFRFRANTPGT